MPYAGVISTAGPRQWQGIPGIERAANGRLWCVFYSGGSHEPQPENHILLTTSDDNGQTWSEPAVVAQAPGAARLYDPTLWHDPRGRLWLIYNRASIEARDYSVWAITTRTSDRAQPEWSAPRPIHLESPFAFRMNKPVVLEDGGWLLPVTWAKEKPQGWFPHDAQLQGGALSTDRGESWTLYGDVQAPPWALENMFLTCADGSVLMWIRAGGGRIWQSRSVDGGRTWSEGQPTDVENPGARFYLGRLQSGRVLLINTPNPKRRTSLWATLSENDGRSWIGGLELDRRGHVSYPDATQAPDGTIFSVHDHDRRGAGEIDLRTFTEGDILNGQP